jgi:hypothetical protein
MYKLLNLKKVIGYNKIRLGPLSDGGYVFLDDSTKDDKIAYSFGIETYDPFSLEMEKRGYKIYQYDGTIHKGLYNSPNIIFEKLMINNNIHEIIKRNNHENKKIILKCDIEGGEYNSFLNLEEQYLKQFTQIVIEVHWLYKDFENAVTLFNKLNRTHQLIHLHGNNYGGMTNVLVLENNIGKVNIIPDVIECSYVLKDLYHFEDDLNSWGAQERQAPF